VPAHFTEAGGLAFVERQWGRQESGEGLSLAIAEASSGDAVGAIVLIFREEPGSVGIGYWLIPRARGRRLAVHAVGLLAPWALAQVGIDRIEALADADNIASRRVLVGNGFLQESGLRRWAGGDGESELLLVYSRGPADTA
jgi:RimJ/RimL family protein N-acetyltransferase